MLSLPILYFLHSSLSPLFLIVLLCTSEMSQSSSSLQPPSASRKHQYQVSCPPSPLPFLKMVLTHLSTFLHTTRLQAPVPVGGSPLDLLQCVDASVVTGNSRHWHSTPESFTILQQRGGLTSAYFPSLVWQPVIGVGFYGKGTLTHVQFIIDQDGLILLSRVIF